MTRLLTAVVGTLSALALVACSPTDRRAPEPVASVNAAQSTTPTPTPAAQEERMIISVNGHELQVELADNSSARALQELVAAGDVRVSMADYGDFEKVGDLPKTLPTNDEQITTRPGDLILYQGDKLALYYASNSWSFTRIGRVTGVDGDQLRSILGRGAVTVTLSQDPGQSQRGTRAR